MKFAMRLGVRQLATDFGQTRLRLETAVGERPALAPPGRRNSCFVTPRVPHSFLLDGKPVKDSFWAGESNLLVKPFSPVQVPFVARAAPTPPQSSGTRNIVVGGRFWSTAGTGACHQGGLGRLLES